MTNTQLKLTEDEFDARFPLMPNHLNPYSGWGDEHGCLFETHGEELDFVRQQDRRTIWTLVDGESGDILIESGFHLVNRIGYLISRVALPEGTDIHVCIPMSVEE